MGGRRRAGRRRLTLGRRPAAATLTGTVGRPVDARVTFQLPPEVEIGEEFGGLHASTIWPSVTANGPAIIGILVAPAERYGYGGGMRK